jgi:hypothetical protein
VVWRGFRATFDLFRESERERLTSHEAHGTSRPSIQLSGVSLDPRLSYPRLENQPRASMAQAQAHVQLKMARPMVPQKQAVTGHLPPCDGARARAQWAR